MSNEDISLSIVLNCEQTKSSETKQVRFNSLPITPLEIKKKIEEDFSIPSCIQTLSYQSMILKDSDELQHTHFRSGDTFSVNYPIEAECQMAQDAIKWLKKLLELFESIEEADEEKNLIIESANLHEIEDLILEGDKDNITSNLSSDLFTPWEKKMKQVNHYYFQQKGGLEVLMKVYGLLVDKDWVSLGLDEQFSHYLEYRCVMAVSNYVQTFPLRRQVIQLGGLDMCMKTLLRRKMGRVGNDEIDPDSFVVNAFLSALTALCSFSELPECQVPLAMRTDVIDQILAMACCSDYKVLVTIVSVNMIMCLAQCPTTHPYLVRSEVIEDLLKVCTLRQKLDNEQPLAEREDPVAFKALQCYTCTALAEIGLGSPDLYSSIPLHLQEQILGVMLDMLETVPPADIRQYEEKVTMAWGTFLPYMQFLYKPSTNINQVKRLEFNAAEDLRHNLHIHCCNVLLHGLENALGRDLHLEILIKEGLLDYTMCLPAVLPGECQPRARSLVNELGKHRQLQPPSLCTLAKAHVAKTFCGLQAVMEMNSIGEFVHKYLSVY